jgi:hypothetical protein
MHHLMHHILIPDQIVSNKTTKFERMTAQKVKGHKTTTTTLNYTANKLFSNLDQLDITTKYTH